MYDQGEPVTRPPSPLVRVSVAVPGTNGLYVNVLAANDADHESVVGVKVPPAPPSLNVTVSVVASAGVTVKVDDAPTPVPLVGPVSVYATSER